MWARVIGDILKEKKDRKSIQVLIYVQYTVESMDYISSDF